MTAIPKPSKKKTKKRKRLAPLPSLIKKADEVFSRYIRERDAIDLRGNCCTCGKPGNQAGHFIKRSYKSLRWYPHNVHLQCARCNHYLDGNQDEYARFIVNKYGVDEFNQMMLWKQSPIKLTREMVQDIIDQYK